MNNYPDNYSYQDNPMARDTPRYIYQIWQYTAGKRYLFSEQADVDTAKEAIQASAWAGDEMYIMEVNLTHADEDCVGIWEWDDDTQAYVGD